LGLPLVVVHHPLYLSITANHRNSMAPWSEVKSIEKEFERVIDEPGIFMNCT
jgi:hypothetical protein